MLGKRCLQRFAIVVLQRRANHEPAVKTTLVQGCMPAMGHRSVQR